MIDGSNQAATAGSCLCGTIRFRIHGPLAPIEVCFCSQCRKAQGGPLAANVPVARESFEFISGAERLLAFESSPGKLRHFCGKCGAPVYSTRSAAPQVLRVRAGLLDGPLAARPVSQAHVASKANWWDADGRLPQFAGARAADGRCGQAPLP